MDTPPNQYYSWIWALTMSFSIVALLSCSNPVRSEVVVQLLENSDLEVGSTEPDSWTSYVNSPADTHYVCAWTDEEAFSPSKSIKIELNPIYGWRGGAVWMQTVLIDPGSFRGNDLLLECSIMKKIISGNGAMLMITTFDSRGLPLQSVSRADHWIYIQESRYWYTTSLRLKNLSSGTRRIKVFLGLQSGANGSIYFDDINLTVLK